MIPKQRKRENKEESKQCGLPTMDGTVKLLACHCEI